MSLYDDLTWRGLIHSVTDAEELRPKLDSGGLTAYAGFDPSADSLHVGHLMLLVTMRRLQEAGHRPIVLAGGATGMVGDPSWKATERPLLDDATLARNVAGIQNQLSQFLDFDGHRSAVLVNNADWTKPISVIDFLRDVGKHFTVNQLIARESVKARLEDREQGISFTEFSYSLLQANDFLHLFQAYGCTLQMGASDQWGNIVGGVDLIRRRLGEKSFGLCTPLVTKADGTKFGKTESGAVWLDPARTSPYAMYQFFVQSEDAVVDQYLKFFTFLSHEEIESLARATAETPHLRQAQKALALAVTSMVHGESEARRAIDASQALFSEDIFRLDEALLLAVTADAPSTKYAKDSLGEVTVVDALVKTGLVPSSSAARTAIEQGGVSLNNRKVESVDAVIENAQVLHGAYAVLRRGKRNIAVAQFS